MTKHTFTFEGRFTGSKKINYDKIQKIFYNYMIPNRISLKLEAVGTTILLNIN